MVLGKRRGSLFCLVGYLSCYEKDFLMYIMEIYYKVGRQILLSSLHCNSAVNFARAHKIYSSST